MNAFNPPLMNLFQSNLHFNISDPEMFLKKIISNLISRSESITAKTHSIIINGIDSTILLKENSKEIIPIIEELLTTVISNSLDSQIYITAEKYKDVIILNIQDRNNNNGYAMAFSVMSVEQQVNEAGGSLKIDGRQSKVATVTFSFPNLAAAC